MLRANEMEFRIPTDVAYDELRVSEEDLENTIRETIKYSNIQK